jgi:hypothetical protein
MIQPFFNDDEDMEMPCVCDCGRIFDLHDGIPHPKKNITVCWKCGERLKTIDRLETEINALEYDIECELVGKREGKKRLKELRKQLEQIENQ